MDVGIFKASKTRLVLWILVPPILVTVVGMSSIAYQQRADWRLKETNALSDVLPDVISARKNVQTLFDALGVSKSKRITTGDQLIGLLEEGARQRNIVLKRTQILERDKAAQTGVPTITAVMEAYGEFSDFQLFLNDVKSAHPLVSARSIALSQGRDSPDGEEFDIKVVFDLLLVGDVMKATGDFE